MKDLNRLKRMTSINVEKNADISHLNETNDELRPAEEHEINK